MAINDVDASHIAGGPEGTEVGEITQFKDGSPAVVERSPRVYLKNGYKVSKDDVDERIYRYTDCGLPLLENVITGVSGVENGGGISAMCGGKHILSQIGKNTTYTYDDFVVYDFSTNTAVTVDLGSVILDVVDDGLGRAVAVGESGRIYYSDDGLNWTQALNAGSSRRFECVTTDGQGNWYAIDDVGGYIHRSVDNGVTWSDLGVVPGMISASIPGIVANHETGTLLTYFNNTQAYRSTDMGITWQEVTISFLTNELRQSASCVDGVIYISNSRDATQGLWASYDDGLTYERLFSETYQRQRVKKCKDFFVWGTLMSPDALNWREISVEGYAVGTISTNPASNELVLQDNATIITYEDQNEFIYLATPDSPNDYLRVK